MRFWALLLVAPSLFPSPVNSIPSCRDYLKRRVEGVFHYDRHTRYQLTFDEALMACKLDFGAEMASGEQLLVAYTSGMEECRAGWLISGEVAYPRIQRNWKCGENKTGIISYGIRKDRWEKWDVFCYKLDDDCSMYNRRYLMSLSNHLLGSLYNVSVPPHPEEKQLVSPTSRSELSQTTVKQINILGAILGSQPPQLNEHNSSSAAHIHLPVSIYATDSPPLAKGYNADNLSTRFPSKQSISYKELLTEIVPEGTSPVINDFVTTSAGSERQSSAPLSINLTGVSEIALRDPTIGLLGLTLPITVGREMAEPVTSEMQSSSHNSSKTTLAKATFGAHGEFNTDSSNSQITPLHPTAWTMDNRLKSGSVTLSDEVWEATSGRGDVHTFGATNGDDLIRVPVENQMDFLSQRVQRLDKPKKLATTISHTSQGPVYAAQSQKVGPDEKMTITLLPLNQIKEATSDIPNASPFIIDIEISPGPITEQEIDLKTTDQPSVSNTSHHIILTSQPTTYLEREEAERFHLFSPESASHLSTLTAFTVEDKHPITSARQEPGRSSGTAVASFRIQEPKSTAYTEKPHESLAPSVNKTEATQSFKQPSPTYEPLDTCGGVLRGKAGQFQSPGFPLSYQSDMDCKWLIESPVGHRVVLDFLKLALEEHRRCLYDYVLVYDGTDDMLQELGRFCGSHLPPQLRSTSNVMTLVMRSDSSLELDGFFAQFSSMKSTSETIRLVGGRNLLEGLVEVGHQGIWGGICVKHWEQVEAQVVCRQLGYTGSAITSRRISRNNNDRVSVSYVKCKGNESTLENCDLKYSGRCGTQERAGVICQVLDSCAALKSAGVLESGVYTIDPDGSDHGEDPFPVECDMQSEKTTGITIVGHNAEVRVRVSPCKDAGCYSRNITYKDASMDQLRALTEVSESCEQFVKLECRHIRFLKDQWGWWVSRDGQKVNSWGGASTNSGKCACAGKGTCALGLQTCNCDANDGVWRKDEGLLTDKSMLPIQAVRFGDTRDVPVEMAFHSIGKLRCWGNGMKLPILKSCAALKEEGYTESGFYAIDPDGNGQGFSQFEAYCDMTSDPTTGITEVSHDSENRIRVTPCEEAGCYQRELRYGTELAQLNALTKVSDSCEQYVRLDCRHIRFIQSGWGWWISWNGEKMFYWGGADQNHKGCACGITGSCGGSGKLCNCDNNDHVWRTDDGYLRDKQALPLKAVHLGDTQDPPLEIAYHTIGKLRCRGRESIRENHLY